MNNVIAGLIRSFKGYSHETVGVINGFFESPEQTLCCASKITETTGRTVEVCGTSLCLEL